MQKFRIAVEVEAPVAATHFTGDILDGPQWWKFSINSTGVIRVWCWYSTVRNEWMIGGEHEPHFLKSIEDIKLKD